MLKLLVPVAVAASALAFAAPASAQWYPQPYGYGYGSGYGYGGYGNYGQVRRLQVRIDMIQRDIARLRAQRALSRHEYDRLRRESRSIEYRLRREARFGLSPFEARDVEYRIARLENHIRREVMDGRRWGYRRYAWGY
jgi:hypothetical protein